jgi:hypothetical protein
MLRQRLNRAAVPQEDVAAAVTGRLLRRRLRSIVRPASDAR